jgi:hypothetical protein
MVKHLPPKIDPKASLKGGALALAKVLACIHNSTNKMLTNIPDNTPLYMLAPKCTYKAAPEPQRLENILLHHTRSGPRFSVTVDTPERPYRHYIHLQHLVNYYGKYVSPVSGYAEANPLEFLFIAEDDLHANRSLAALEVDRLEGKEFDENYNCEWCAPRACACCPCCEFHEDEEEEMVAALPTVTAKPSEAEALEAFRASLKELEKKVDVVLACQEMSRRLAEMRISMLPK